MKSDNKLATQNMFPLLKYILTTLSDVYDCA